MSKFYTGLGLLIILIACAAFVYPDDKGDKIDVKRGEITVEDLASALRVKGWRFNIQFQKPVKRLSLHLCELRRKPDGTWQSESLGPAISYGYSEPRRSATTSFFTSESEEENWFSLSLEGGSIRERYQRKPDFTGMYFTQTGVKVISNCIVLAAQEKPSPNHQKGQVTITDDETKLVRLIGLQIEVDEE